MVEGCCHPAQSTPARILGPVLGCKNTGAVCNARPYNARMAKSKRNKPSDNTISQNKRARFDYHLLQSFEAGVSLAGWEVKSLRAGKVQLTDSYVLMKGGEAFLLGANITPLDTVSTHFVSDPTRTRKLLLHKKELAQINAGVTQKGQTCVCTAL